MFKISFKNKLTDLNDDTLKTMGINSVGDRQRILDQIAAGLPTIDKATAPSEKVFLFYFELQRLKNESGNGGIAHTTTKHYGYCTKPNCCYCADFYG